MSKGIEVLADSARGVYVPQHFAETCGGTWTGFTAEQLATLLEGPDSEGYWDVWHTVENTASFIDGDGNLWALWIGENGDLFAICEQLMTDAEYLEFFGEARE